jgi:hypothetical protein
MHRRRHRVGALHRRLHLLGSGLIADTGNNAILIENLRVTNQTIRESPCGTNTAFRNNTLGNSTQNVRA